jgi:hypothetical protein
MEQARGVIWWWLRLLRLTPLFAKLLDEMVVGDFLQSRLERVGIGVCLHLGRIG